MLNPRSITARAFTNPKALAMNMSSINRPDVLRLEFPSMNGIGEARAIAKVYGALRDRAGQNWASGERPWTNSKPW